MKSSIRALAEVKIFQAIVIDSKSRKRAIAIYACGTDVLYADDAVGLFDRDRRRVAPEWIKEQLKLLPAGGVLIDWQGNKTAESDGSTLIPVGPAGDTPLRAAPHGLEVVLRTPPGEDLGESSIAQG